MGLTGLQRYYSSETPLTPRQSQHSLNMADTEAGDGQQPKKKKYLIRFKSRREQWILVYPFLRESKRGETYALCSICNTDFSIGHGGENDIKRHVALNKHVQTVAAPKSTQNVSNFFAGSSSSCTEDKIIKAELLFTGFLCEHNLPISTADHSGKMFKRMFPDSKIAQKYACGRTKTTHILSGAVAKESVGNLKALLNEPSLNKWFGIATDGSSDENDKFLPILIRNFAEDGFVTTSLVDMPDIDKGSDAKAMFETCTSSLKKASLTWDSCCTYSSDNTSSMVGKNKSLLKMIKDSQQIQKVFDVGCPCHLAHLSAQKGAKKLSMQVDDFIIDLFYHFKRSVKRKATLREYMELTNTDVKKIIKHVTTRWLSLGKLVDRTLLHWEALRSFFQNLRRIILMVPTQLQERSDWQENLRIHFLNFMFCLCNQLCLCLITLIPFYNLKSLWYIFYMKALSSYTERCCHVSSKVK